jgi:hypothetical protein
LKVRYKTTPASLNSQIRSIFERVLKEEMQKGEISKLTQATLKSKKREVVRDWIASGKIKSENSKV